MDRSNTAAARKLVALRFGLMGAAIANPVKVLSKPQAHDFNKKPAVSWAIITQDGRLIKATTYDGNLGKRFNIGDHNTVSVPSDEKVLRRALKGYSEVEVTTCPIVEVTA